GLSSRAVIPRAAGSAAPQRARRGLPGAAQHAPEAAGSARDAVRGADGAGRAVTGAAESGVSDADRRVPAAVIEARAREAFLGLARAARVGSGLAAERLRRRRPAVGAEAGQARSTWREHSRRAAR